MILRQPVAVGLYEVVHKAADLIDGQFAPGMGVQHGGLIDVLLLPGESGIYGELVHLDLPPIQRGELIGKRPHVAGGEMTLVYHTGDFHTGIEGQVVNKPSIVFTSVDIPFWSLPAAMTSNTKERSEIVGFTTTASNTITGIIGLVMPMALAFFGEFNWYVYFFLALAVAVWGVTMYLISFKLVREHVVPDDSEKFELKLALKNIFQNKPLLLIQISNIFCLLGMMLKGYLNYYYCVYNWGSLGYMTVLNLINLVGMVVGALIFTFLSQHIGKKNCMFLFAGLMTISSLVLYFAGYHNAIVLFATSSVSTVCVGAVMVCVNAMMMDTIEYGEWKTGQRNEAMITSTRCFVTKCVMAVAGIAVAAVIGLTGYIPQETVQPVNVLNSFHFVYTLVSAGIIILAVVPMLFYKLTEKRHAEIMEELAARKASKTQ